jgi:hypothetical protein
MPWEVRFDPSQALRRIHVSTPEYLEAEARGGSPAMFLEALAQACGLHARWRARFMVQVRLVSMADIRLQPDRGTHVHASLQAATASGARYRVEADFLAAPAAVTLALLPEASPQILFQNRFQWLAS